MILPQVFYIWWLLESNLVWLHARKLVRHHLRLRFQKQHKQQMKEILPHPYPCKKFKRMGARQLIQAAPTMIQALHQIWILVVPQPLGLMLGNREPKFIFVRLVVYFYPCSFLVLDSPNMEFLFGLDMLRKHQCIIDLKESVLRVGGEKDMPSRFLDEEKYAKEASGSGGHITSGSNNPSTRGHPSGGASSDRAKIFKNATIFVASCCYIY
ncbi:DNA damage-inducible protein 1 isoform X3 [Vigna radiata var. radiata]|uniref:DNA damage-inducible protein 1 isoform X3 n=1 Tax=Vigna radiata var. radiata TaxID=3916 RepID=A0A1S3U6F7_VIGRR|nr:DNA damage-inducible protein 1 isoform X3 [Vigna radiata var. radiata]XP_022636854.1 DNA damage-inducible protein 1 isoform X3 [Vigna radiata var. radiata]XP_022636855.1 DNA damage-inducible protein 1 isoform X3 [Vigna radiata var. radiata]